MVIQALICFNQITRFKTIGPFLFKIIILYYIFVVTI